MEYLLTLVMRTSDQVEELSPMRRAILYIETHFRESPTLADAAAEACLSAVYFGNQFKKVMGETFISYLNSRKVSCAMMLLERGASVTEACYSAGFGSLSGFLYTFKKKTGLTPAEYKRLQVDSKEGSSRSEDI